MKALSIGDGVLQRVAQRPAGVVHEHVVERRALHRQRLHGDAAPAPPLRSAPCVVAGPLRDGDPEDVVLRRDTLSTSGSAARRSAQSGGRAAKLTSSDVLAGNRRLELQRRIERHELAVVDDRDAIAELVGFVHVVRREQDREIALAP